MRFCTEKDFLDEPGIVALISGDLRVFVQLQSGQKISMRDMNMICERLAGHYPSYLKAGVSGDKLRIRSSSAHADSRPNKRCATISVKGVGSGRAYRISWLPTPTKVKRVYGASNDSAAEN